VSSTLRDLVIGSGLEFEERGAHQLKGVPGECETSFGTPRRADSDTSDPGMLLTGRPDEWYDSCATAEGFAKGHGR
jgi:hypothetical protein